MNKRFLLWTYVLFRFLGCSAVYAAAEQAMWTAKEFWRDGVEWYLDEYRESICDELSKEGNPQPLINDVEWSNIKKDVHGLYLQSVACPYDLPESKYLFDDQELKYLLDRWFELCQAEGFTAEILLQRAWYSYF
jgi:hypothetical protein